MELGLAPHYVPFRSRVEAFARRHARPGERWSAEDQAAFRRLAAAEGYLYRSVPRRFGGGEQAPDPVEAQIIETVFTAAGLPLELKTIGVQMLVPTLLAHGTDWQKDRFVRDTIEGRIVWCQGYSEPDAGSDLASLRTRAELVGPDWIVNGQKIWTSYARDADYMFALVRTEAGVKGRAGITYMLLDMRQPGITVRPLKQIDGASTFNEVFLSDARTPADWIVGARGQGWQVSKSLLKHERNRLGAAERTTALFNSLLKLARRARFDDEPAIAAADVRGELVRLYAQAEINRLSAMIQTSAELDGPSAGGLQVYNKLYTSLFSGRTAQFAAELIQSAGLIEPGGGGDERWVGQYMNSIAASIAGGTSNIQRNIIAERHLGLPRDRQSAER